MNLFRLSAGITLLAGATLGQAAQATIYIATYEGVVTEGFWKHGVYLPENSLNGLAFKAVFTIDDSKGNISENSTHSQIDGYGLSSPVSAVVTIGSDTFQISGNEYGAAKINSRTYEYNYSDTIYHQSKTHSATIKDGYEVSHVYQLTMWNQNTTSGLYGDYPDFRTSIDHIFGVYDFPISNQFYYGNYSHDGKGNWLIYDLLSISSVSLTRLTVAPLVQPPGPGPVAPGVPEPATWALMISGFGLVGAAVRRRRTALTAG